MYLLHIIFSPYNNININIPTQSSINVTQAHNSITYPVHIPLVIERLFFFSFLALCGAYPQLYLSTSSSKNQHNCHHSITPISYLHHILTQLLLHHSSCTTNSISFSRPPQLISPSPTSLNPILSISPHANNTHQPSITVLHKLLPFHSDFLYSTSQPTAQGTNHASHHVASYACVLQGKGLTFLFDVLSCHSPKHLD